MTDRAATLGGDRAAPESGAGESSLQLSEVHGPDHAAERFSGARAVRRLKRQILDEPTDQLNLRATIADINTFVEWCERNRYSYREGFGELVKGIGARSAEPARARG
jgi:hypothetical protein